MDGKEKKKKKGEFKGKKSTSEPTPPILSPRPQRREPKQNK